jgi:hypothetical protein
LGVVEPAGAFGVVEPPDGLGTTAGLPVNLSIISFVPAPSTAPVIAFVIAPVLEPVLVVGLVTTGLTTDVGGVVLVAGTTGLFVMDGLGVVFVVIDVFGVVGVVGVLGVVLDVNVVLGT